MNCWSCVHLLFSSKQKNLKRYVLFFNNQNKHQFKKYNQFRKVRAGCSMFSFKPVFNFYNLFSTLINFAMRCKANTQSYINLEVSKSELKAHWSCICKIWKKNKRKTYCENFFKFWPNLIKLLHFCLYHMN